MKNRQFEGSPVAKDALPSYLQFGDYCDFIVCNPITEDDDPNQLTAGKVIKIHFSPNKITYDLEFTVSLDSLTKVRNVTRVHNVDSAFVVLRDQQYLDQIASLKERKYVKSDVGLQAWYGQEERPEQVLIDSKKEGRPHQTAGYSKDVLIDMDGYRKNFRIGWYDFDDKEWRLHDKGAEESLDIKNMRWQTLPLA